MALWLSVVARSQADVPRLLQYQGRLFQASAPVDGPGEFKFALVNASGSFQFWANSGDQNGDGEPDAAVVLNLSRGTFAVLLGDTSIPNMAALPAEIFATDPLYLRVWYGGRGQPFALLAPDQRLGAVAYSLMAASVPDASITAPKLAPGALQAAQIAGVLGPAQVPGLDAAKVVSGRFDIARLPESLVAQTTSLATQLSALQQQVAALPGGPIDAGRITTGQLDAARLPNWLLQEVSLAASRADDVQRQLNSISQAGVPLPAGTTRASEQVNDSTLTGQGYELFASIPAPAWQIDASPNAPTARRGHTGLWTGQALLIWGGDAAGGVYLNSGALYSPSDASWTPVSPVNAPGGRTGHSAVWTGQEMIIWGGYGGAFLDDGARFDPSSQRWTPLNSAGAPTGRDGHAAVWTGTKMVVWGGRNSAGVRGDGGIWDPAANSWTPTPMLAAPSARKGAAAVWTGSAVIVWGGDGAGGPVNTGGVLSFSGGPAPDWRSLNIVNAPLARRGHSVIWTGQFMIIWGGENNGGAFADGAIYDPTSDAWTPLPPADGSPSARSGHIAVWTGREMVVQGGQGASGPLASGSAFNPVTRRWRTLTVDGGALPRANAAAGWTGTQLLVFGGQADGLPVAALQRLNPQPAFYLYRKL